MVPRVLLISYHDFLYRTETVAPLISRFLGLKFDESVTADSGNEVLQSGRVRRGETSGRQKRSLIQQHANGVAEAWVLYRGSRSYKLLNRINGTRARIAGSNLPTVGSDSRRPERPYHPKSTSRHS